MLDLKSLGTSTAAAIPMVEPMNKAPVATAPIFFKFTIVLPPYFYFALTQSPGINTFLSFWAFSFDVYRSKKAIYKPFDAPGISPGLRSPKAISIGG
jgi:hypothetical protein